MYNKTLIMHRQLKKITREDDQAEATIDVQELIRNAGDTLQHLQKTVIINGTPVLQNKTLEDINREVYSVISQNAPPHKHKELCDKLVGYRVVHELPELQKSKAVKILKYKGEDLKLQTMGVVMSIKFYDNGTHVVCMVPPRMVMQFKYNETVAVFQKISEDEYLFLTMDAI